MVCPEGFTSGKWMSICLTMMILTLIAWLRCPIIALKVSHDLGVLFPTSMWASWGQKPYLYSPSLHLPGIEDLNWKGVPAQCGAPCLALHSGSQQSGEELIEISDKENEAQKGAGSITEWFPQISTWAVPSLLRLSPLDGTWKKHSSSAPLKNGFNGNREIPQKKEITLAVQSLGTGGEKGEALFTFFLLTSWSWVGLPEEIIWEGNLCIYYLKARCVRWVIIQSVAIRWGLQRAGWGPFPPFLLPPHPTSHHPPSVLGTSLFKRTASLGLSSRLGLKPQ